MTFRRTVVVLTTLVALAAGAWLAVLWNDGYRLYAVASGSMEPALPVGGVVVTAPPTDHYEAGDIITYPSGPGAALEVTTHRVAAVDGTDLQTWGDANPSPDPTPVAVDEVVGVVVASAPALGYLLVFLQQPTGVPALLGSLVMLIILWDLFLAEPEQQPARRERRRAHAAAPA